MISVEEQTKYNYPLPSYPKGRDGIFMPTPLDWLTVKQVSDNLPISEAQPRLWRIHNKLYDLTKFKHPGGKDFIEMTMNTDITELFETSHLQPKALKEILQKYYVADIATPRFTAYLTFEDKGFYCTLRQRVYEYLQSSQLRKKMTYWQSTAFVHDVMLIVFVLLLVPISTSKFYSNEIIAASIAAGMVLACIGNCAHNFFHLANNWRAFSFDLCLNSSYEWRISHVYSHHNYANTVLDYEINAFEPMINFMPYSWKQAWYTPVVTMLLMVVVFPLATMIGFLKRMAFMARGKRAVRWEYFLGLIVFLICAVVHMMVVTKQSSGSLLEAFWLAVKTMIQRFVVLHASSSTLFLHLGLSATHHHPDIWHASDVVRDGKSLGTAEKSLDYGIFQLIAVGHRPEVDASLWMSSVTFGRHGLHHMFPTLDLCVLSHLKEILWQTCKDFHVEDIATVDVKTAEGEQRRTAWGKKRAISTWNSWWGMIRQCFRAHANANNFPSHLFVKKGN